MFRLLFRLLFRCGCCFAAACANALREHTPFTKKWPARERTATVLVLHPRAIFSAYAFVSLHKRKVCEVHKQQQNVQSGLFENGTLGLLDKKLPFELPDSFETILKIALGSFKLVSEDISIFQNFGPFTAPGHFLVCKNVRS